MMLCCGAHKIYKALEKHFILSLSMNFHEDADLTDMVRFIRSGTIEQERSETSGAHASGFFMADPTLDERYSRSPPLILRAERKQTLSRSKSRTNSAAAMARKASRKRNQAYQVPNELPRKEASAPTRPTSEKVIVVVRGGTGSTATSTTTATTSATTSATTTATTTATDTTISGDKNSSGGIRKNHSAKPTAPFFAAVRTPIKPIAAPSASGLSRLFAGNAAGMDSSMLRLLIYLPNRSPVKVQLPEDGTVDDAIKLVMRTHRESGDEPILKGSAASYELRLHDEDGEPEDDFPALDRSREVKHFGDDGVHEYCLCVIEGKEPKSEDEVCSPEEAKENPTDGRLLRINMPNGLHTTQDKRAARTLRDLIPVLARKYRLPLYHETVQFEVSQEDQARLQMMSNALELSTRLADLNVSTINLMTKKYSDAPSQAHKGLRRWDSEESGAAGAGGRARARSNQKIPSSNKGAKRPPESAFLYNEVTAAIYKEWTIVKINRWGRRQRRIFGVDLSKIYNKKIKDGTKQRLGSTKGVRREERLITDVKSIEYVEGVPTNFKLSHAEGDGQQVLEYEAETPHECVEIVVKIKTILNLMHKRDDKF